ncbi:MAG: hypothetical protein ACOC7Z_02120 [Candidatus Bipolaricaulota bacterium]
MEASFKISLVVLVSLLIIGAPALTQNSNGEVASNDWINKILTFFQTLAEYIGKGLVSLIDQVANVKLNQLEEPLGYLGVLTIFLGVLSMISAAKKVLWFIVMLGWGLIIVRIVMEVVNYPNA